MEETKWSWSAANILTSSLNVQQQCWFFFIIIIIIQRVSEPGVAGGERLWSHQRIFIGVKLRRASPHRDSISRIFWPQKQTLASSSVIYSVCRSDSRCLPTCGCCSAAPPPANTPPRRRSCVSIGRRRWSPNSRVEQMCTNNTAAKRRRSSFQTLLIVWLSSGLRDASSREGNHFSAHLRHAAEESGHRMKKNKTVFLVFS